MIVELPVAMLACARMGAIQWADALPKTRSGKIMRRLLRKISAGQVNDLRDTTTIADPSVVYALVQGRLTIKA
jgi:acetyl-CoA synthetase